MNHWPFIIAAYTVTIAGTVAVSFASYIQMRHAERRADALRRDRE